MDSSLLHFYRQGNDLRERKELRQSHTAFKTLSLIYLILLLSSQEKEAGPLKTQAECGPRGSGAGHCCQPVGAAALGSLVSKPTQHAKESSRSFEELR